MTAPWWTSHNGESEVRLHHGHVIDVLRALPEESVHCVVTSPPYWGLRDYGLPPTVWGGDPECPHEWGEWEEGHEVREEAVVGKSRTTDRFYGGDPTRRFDGNHQKHTHGAFCQRCGAWMGCLGLEPTLELYVAHMVDVFQELRRVLRRDGTLWLNLGDCYGGGTRATRDYSRATKHGYWANPAIDRRLPAPAKQLLGIPWHVAIALQSDGWWLRSDIIWQKPNSMPESVTDRPARSHEYLFLLAKSERYYYDAAAIAEPVSATSRKLKMPDGWDTGPGAHGSFHRNGRERGRTVVVDAPPLVRNKRDVWSIATEPFPEAHFATFPQALVEPCILAGTSPQVCPRCGAPWRRVRERTGHRNGREAAQVPGNTPTKTDSTGRAPATVATNRFEPGCRCAGNDGSGRAVVLDPFVGSGTTVLVAQRLGRIGWGIDLNPGYLEMARRRVEKEHRQMRLPTCL